MQPERTSTRENARQVLLVDDEERFRGILARYLRQRGHAVDEAASAEQAREQLRAARYDVLVLDVNLPGDTGWEIVRELASASARPSMIVISAVPPSPLRVAQLRPDAVLTKPFPIDALARLVESDCELVSEADVD